MLTICDPDTHKIDIHSLARTKIVLSHPKNIHRSIALLQPNIFQYKNNNNNYDNNSNNH